MIFLLNDEHFDSHWTNSDLQHVFFRPQHWPERVPIVNILAYTLMPNHVHFILKEVKKGGTTLFMKRIGQSMTNHSNEKYNQTGSLWQGSFKSRTINTDDYLRYAAAYVMVKNTFELYPEGGLTAAKEKFDMVWDWAIKQNFSSLADYAGFRADSPILQKGLLGELFADAAEFRDFSKDVILGGKWEKLVDTLE